MKIETEITRAMEKTGGLEIASVRSPSNKEQILATVIEKCNTIMCKDTLWVNLVQTFENVHLELNLVPELIVIHRI